MDILDLAMAEELILLSSKDALTSKYPILCDSQKIPAIICSSDSLLSMVPEETNIVSRSSLLLFLIAAWHFFIINFFALK